MRPNYPLLSEELNDIFQDAYYKLVYILGYDGEDGTLKYLGKYDEFENRIREQIFTIVFDLILGTPHVYPTWGQFIEINNLRRL